MVDDLLIPFQSQPWLGWLMICLARQVERQKWLKEVLEQNLKDVEKQSGDVPGLPGWSFELHGSGLCLKGPGGEYIDHDVFSQDIRAVDPYFFAWRLVRLEAPVLPEVRLLRWLPTADVLVASLEPLKKNGFLWGQHCITLSTEWDKIGRYEYPWDGTLPDAGDLEGFLISLMEDRQSARSCLDEVLPLLGPERAKALCLTVIQGPIDAATAHAVEGLSNLGTALKEVQALCHRLDSKRDHPFPACSVARYLFVAGQREEGLDLVLRFAAVEKVEGFLGNPMLDELTFLALEWAPESALPLVRRALRSTIPIVVRNMAALLSLLEKPWCHRELSSALAEPNLEQDNRRVLTKALSRWTGPQLVSGYVESQRPLAQRLHHLEL